MITLNKQERDMLVAFNTQTGIDIDSIIKEALIDYLHSNKCGICAKHGTCNNGYEPHTCEEWHLKVDY